jgi:hypothetical protein
MWWVVLTIVYIWVMDLFVADLYARSFGVWFYIHVAIVIGLMAIATHRLARKMLRRC